MRQRLRDYQQQAIDEIRAHYQAGRRRVLLVLPTAGGKTTVAAEIIHGAVERGRRIWFLAHRKELIDQASNRLDEFGVEHGVIMASHPRWRPFDQVQVASIQTLARRIDHPSIATPDLVIIDEAHRARAQSYLDMLAHWPPRFILGLTASPWRQDGKGLGGEHGIFDAVVVASSPSELTEAGYLVPALGFGFGAPDLDDVKVKRTGDYDEGGLVLKMNTVQINGELLSQWKEHASDRTTVVFAINVEHSKSIVEQFIDAGVKAEHLDAKTPKREREAVLKRLGSDETRVVSNVGILTEGWDMPRVSCIVVARPTKSLSLHLQMCGRALRPLPCTCGCTFPATMTTCPDCGALTRKENARIHDHAGNLARHGVPTEERDYSLTADVQKKKKDDTEPAVRNCPACLCCCSPQDLACPACGYVFEVRSGGLDEVEGGLRSLEEIDADRRKKNHKESTTAQRGERYRELLQDCIRRGVDPRKAGQRYWSIYGVNARFPEIYAEVVGDGLTRAELKAREQAEKMRTTTEASRRRTYRSMLVTAQAAGHKPGAAAYRYRAVFGEHPVFPDIMRDVVGG